jgi:CheY-like chemotaxis protein
MAPTEQQRAVLVVEPDVLVRLVIADYLRDCGYKVIEAVGAQDVWAVLETGRPVDVMLIDVKLSGTEDGFAVANRIRQTGRDIDVILTSGIPAAAQQCHELCEEGPIKKPYQPKDVEARIRILLERRRATTKP